MITINGQMPREHCGRAARTQVRRALGAHMHVYVCMAVGGVWEGAEGDGGLGRGWRGRIRRPHDLGRPHGAGDGARRRWGGL